MPKVVGVALLAWAIASPGLAQDAPPATASTGRIDNGPTPVTPEESINAEEITQAPPPPHPPPYTQLRFNENYRYLADPARRTDPFDSVKFIALSDTDPGSYLSLGGGLRERYEHYTAPGFGIGRNPPHDDYLLQRAYLLADLHFNDHVRFFTEGISGYEWGSKRKPPPTNANPADLQQAFLDYRFFDDARGDADYLVLRAGRFMMSYGSGRLVATRAAPNIPFKFDGIQFIDKQGNYKLYGFFTLPAREQQHRFDDEGPGQRFWGLYGQTQWAGSFNMDLYYLGFRDPFARYATARGLETRHSLGTRLHGTNSGFDYDVEPVIQFGSIAGREILAWTVATSLGYTLDYQWRPRLGVNLDVASGDKGQRPGARFTAFNPLFFKAGYFNDASLIRPTNIMDVHPTLQLQPVRRLTLTFGSDVLWRYTTHDGLYNPPGAVQLPAGSGSRYFATTAEAAAECQIGRHVSIAGSYAHFFTGQYVGSAGGGDVDWYGLWTTFTF